LLRRRLRLSLTHRYRDRTRSPLAQAFVAFVESHPVVVAS
jgi:hypothetical protein